MAMLAPEIIFEDAHLMVLSKPAGLLSQGDVSGEENLVTWLRAYVGRHYVGLIHRLDRNTSGVMLVAKRTKAANRLTEALQKGEIKRTYLGWVFGRLNEPQVWKHWLWKDEKNNQVSVVQSSRAGAKEAVMRAVPLEYKNHLGHDLTLAEFELETGRSHQIRVQAAASGYPLLGDLKYGKVPSVLSGLFQRPALHSYRLVFQHPVNKETLAFSAELPDDFVQIKNL